MSGQDIKDSLTVQIQVVYFIIYFIYYIILLQSNSLAIQGRGFNYRLGIQQFFSKALLFYYRAIAQQSRVVGSTTVWEFSNFSLKLSYFVFVCGCCHDSLLVALVSQYPSNMVSPLISLMQQAGVFLRLKDYFVELLGLWQHPPSWRKHHTTHNN